MCVCMCAILMDKAEDFFLLQLGVACQAGTEKNIRIDDFVYFEAKCTAFNFVSRQSTAVMASTWSDKLRVWIAAG